MKKLRDKAVSPGHSERLSFNINSGRINSPSLLGLKFQKNTKERLIIPRSKHNQLHIIKNKSIIQSMNISRHLIEEEDPKTENIQFRKKIKNNLKPTHGRSKSNQICYIEDIANFSNSLINISQQVIEIPFKKKKTEKDKENAGNAGNDLIKFSRRNGSCSFDKTKGRQAKNSSIDITKHKKQTSLLKKSQFIPKTRNSQKSIFSLIPKPRKSRQSQQYRQSRQSCQSRQPTFLIQQFSLRALKITKKGSIVYLAIHRKSGTIYVIKSLRKASLRGKLDNLIKELKVGLIFGHPNFAKTYGFFSDKDNFYIIKEYLEEGCIMEQKKTTADILIGISLNQVLFSVSCLSDFLELKKWSICPSKLAKSHGILKITSIDFDPDDQGENLESLRETIEWFFENQDRRSTLEGTCSSNFSKNNSTSTLSKSSSSFLETLNNIFELNQNSIFMLLDHSFLRQVRFKATMQE